MRHRHGSTLLRTLFVAVSLCAFAQAAPAQVRVTADNSYALFYRDQSGALTYLGTDTCTAASCIFAPETYAAPQPGQEIYLVAWSDHGASQGLLAEVTAGGTNILGGDPRWRVYATNTTFSGPPSGAAFQTALNNQINSSTAANWVAPAVGEDNAAGSGGFYPPVAGLGGQNRWMWFQSGKTSCGGANSPFQPGCNHNEYLIFRISARDLPQPPCATAGEISSCCLRRGLKRAVYAFAVTVNNQTGGPAALTLTASQATIHTYSPTTLSPGSNLVTGTLSAAPGANVCLLVEVTGGGRSCRFEQCFRPTPDCSAKLDELEGTDGIKVNPDIRVREADPPTRPAPRRRRRN